MKVITCFTFQFSEDDMNAESQFLVNNPSQPSEKIRSLVTKKIHVQPACTSYVITVWSITSSLTSVYGFCLTGSFF